LKNKAFTLIELLAVIVILAIIALIAVPIILNIIDDSKRSTRMRSVELYLDTAGKSVVAYQLKFPDKKIDGSCEVQTNGNLKCEGIEEEIKVEVKGQTGKSGTIVFQEGKIIKVIKLVIGDYEYNMNENGKIIEKEYEEQVLEETPLRCFDYEELEDGTVAITGYNCGGYFEAYPLGYDRCNQSDKIDGEIEDVVIPSMINGKQVTEIGYNAFFPKGCDAIMTGLEGTKSLIKSVKIPEGITHIESSAFCSNELISVSMPSTLTSIGENAFFGNQLTSVTIPDSVQNIGDSAFGINPLTSVIINAPQSQVTMGDSAFGEFDTSKIQWAS